MAGKYLTLYENIKRDIVRGVYRTGEKLPSKRILADENGVSVITAEHAYDLLLEEGYIESRERSGYYVLFSEGDYFLSSAYGLANPGPGADLPGQGRKPSGRPAGGRIFHAAEDGDNGTVRLEKQRGTIRQAEGKDSVQSGEDSGTERPGEDSDIIRPGEDCLSAALYAKTARRVLSKEEEHLTEKSPSFGTRRLRTAISGYLRRSRHIEVSPDRIIIGAGAEYLYGLIIQTLGREKIYGVESPGYHRIEEVYLAGGVSIERLPLKKDGIETGALRDTKAEVLHITPYRSFPSGVTATAGKKTEYLKWSSKRDGLIIEDDFESEFTPLRKAEDTLFSMDREGRVIYVNTFTKTIGPSVRIAYLLLPEKLLPLFEEKIGFYSCPVPTFEQYIVAELIENGDFERHINRVRRKNRARLQEGKQG